MNFILATTLALFLCGSIPAQGPCFKDADKDGKCDVCGREPGGRQGNRQDQGNQQMKGKRQGRQGCCQRRCGGRAQQESAKPAPQPDQASQPEQK